MTDLILTWKRRWLPPSETFVRNQADLLSRYTSHNLGVEAESSSLLRPSDEILPLSPLERFTIRTSGYAPWKSQRLIRRVTEISPALVHAEFASDALSIVDITTTLGLPLVVTAHGMDIYTLPNRPGPLGKLYRRRLLHLFREARLILAVSNDLRSAIIDLGCPPEKVRTHYLGIPLDRRTIAGELPAYAEREYDAVFVGRAVEQKGLMEFLDAVSRCSEQRPIQAVVLGGGPELEHGKRFALERRLNVRFLDYGPPRRAF